LIVVPEPKCPLWQHPCEHTDVRNHVLLK